MTLKIQAKEGHFLIIRTSELIDTKMQGKRNGDEVPLQRDKKFKTIGDNIYNMTIL